MNYFCDGNQGGGQQRYPSWRNTLHGLFAKAALLDTHRNHRERAPPSGMVQPVITTLCSLSLRIERSLVFKQWDVIYRRASSGWPMPTREALAGERQREAVT